MTKRIKQLLEKRNTPATKPAPAPARTPKPKPRRKKLTLHNAQTPEEIRHVVEYQELLAQQRKWKDRDRKRKQ